MKPIEFKEQTSTLEKPESLTDEECGSLPVHMDIVQNLTVSCWEPTDEEIQELIKTKKLYVTMWQIPICPICVHVANPFRMESPMEQLPVDEAIDLGG